MTVQPIETTAPNRLVVISDCTDCAFAEMRGAILRSALAAKPECVFHMEPLVPVHPFSVLNTAFLLRLLAEAYPPRTVLMFIMNSLQQRTERIVGRTLTGDLFFEGTNTGALGWLARDFGVAECYELADPGFVPFGGKFVHAPAVGRLLAGAALSDLGSPFPRERIRSVLPEEGVIMHVDNFGNGKFQLSQSFSPGDRLAVSAAGRRLQATYARRMMDHPDGAWVVYPGSSMGFHEIGQVRGPGLLALQAEPGDVVTIERVESGANNV